MKKLLQTSFPLTTFFASIAGHCTNFFALRSFLVLLTSAIITIIILPGCAYLYKIDTLKEGNTAADTLAALQNSNKHFIIHFKDTAFVLKNPSITNNKMEGNLLPLNQIQLKYAHPKHRNKNLYTKVDASEVLTQVHVYATRGSMGDTANFYLPLSAISRVDINQKNIPATRRSHIVGGVIIAGSILSIIGVFAIIASNSISHMFDNAQWWGG